MSRAANPDYLEKNYYAELGLASSASVAEIKSAYRRLALEYHPDKNPGFVERFHKITEAYEVLTDAEKKANYDRQSPFGYRAPAPSTPPVSSVEEQPSANYSWASFWQPLVEVASLAASLTFMTVALMTSAKSQSVTSREASYCLIGVMMLWLNRSTLDELVKADSLFSASPAA